MNKFIPDKRRRQNNKPPWMKDILKLVRLKQRLYNVVSRPNGFNLLMKRPWSYWSDDGILMVWRRENCSEVCSTLTEETGFILCTAPIQSTLQT